MGKVGDQGSVHLDLDLDGRTAQFGMRRSAGIGCGQSAEPGNVAGQFDDALVVNVVQHKIEVSAPRRDRPWRPRSLVLYMVANGRNTVRPFSLQARKWKPIRPLWCWECGTQASGGKPPRLPVTLRSM